MNLFKLTPKSKKGKDRLSAIRHLHPEWEGLWRAHQAHADQLFLLPHGIPEPERFSRWVEFVDPNFNVLPQPEVNHGQS